MMTEPSYEAGRSGLKFKEKAAAGVIGALVLASSAAIGAPAAVPDTGTIMRGIEKTLPPPPPVLVQPLPEQRMLSPDDKAARFFVRDLHIEATLFPEATLKALVSGYIGREVSVGELEQAAGLIAGFYRDHDLLARAFVPQQSVKDGVVVIRVLEASLGEVKVEPTDKTRLDPEIARGYVLDRQAVGGYLHPTELEESILLLNDLPGVNAKAVLQQGAKEGDTNAVVQMDEGDLFAGSVTFDNFGSRSVGMMRSLGQLSVNDPAGIGDKGGVLLLKTSHSSYARFDYGLPVGYSGLRLGADISMLYYDLDNDFPTLKGNGLGFNGGVNARYPLIRSTDISLAVQGSWEYRHLLNAASGATTADRQVNAVQVGLEGTEADAWFGGGNCNFAASGIGGTVDLSNTASDAAADAAGARSAGVYGKFMANFSRMQHLTEGLSGLLSVQGQWGMKNLDSSEKFSLGGPTAIRAFAVNEASGDAGWLATAELRYAVTDTMQLKTYYDAGGILLHHDTWNGWASSGNDRNSYRLQGVGIGSAWMPLPALSLRFDLVHRVGGNPGHDANGHDSAGLNGLNQMWIQGSYLF